MIQWIKNLNIQKQLLLISSSTLILVSVFIFVALSWIEVQQRQQFNIDNYHSTAKMYAYQLEVALEFSDTEYASNILSASSETDSIVAALVYDKSREDLLCSW